MNHDKARQIEGGTNAGKWQYTSANKRTGTHAIGYCSLIKRCPDCNAQGARLGKNLGDDTACATCGGEAWVMKPESERCYHDTQEEAEAHQKAYLLDNLNFTDDSEQPHQLTRCEAPNCKAMTDGGVQIMGNHYWRLCATHRNRETVGDLLQVGESWHS